MRPPQTLIACFLMVIASGCSIKRMAVNKLGDALASGGSTFETDEDPDLVASAMPFGLKMYERLLAESPKHTGLLLAAASGFTEYAYAFVDMRAEEVREESVDRADALRERARKLYLRANKYGMRGLESRYPGFGAALDNDAAAALKRVRKRDVPLLYWTAASLGLAVSTSQGSPEMIAQLPLVEMIVQRIAELDETYDGGAVPEFLITLDANRSGVKRGRTAKADAPTFRPGYGDFPRQARRNLRFIRGKPCVPAQNAAEFKTMLEKALAVDADADPDNRLANVVAQRRARWLLKHMNELFLQSAPSMTINGARIMLRRIGSYAILLRSGRSLPGRSRSKSKWPLWRPRIRPGATCWCAWANDGRAISNGNVKLTIYAGGVMGDEPDTVNKLRVKLIQAVALSGAGMGDIEKGVACLQIPMMFDSYEELDYVRDRIAPKLEKRIEASGYLVLNWGDAGWVHFFSDKPVTRLDDLRKLKMFTWAGSNDELELWKANGFRPVPLAATDIQMGLKTRLIDAIPTTPLYALWNQCFTLAKYMNDVKWAPLVGATHRFQSRVGEDSRSGARPHAAGGARLRPGTAQRNPGHGRQGHRGHDGRRARQENGQTHRGPRRRRGAGRLAQADRSRLSQNARKADSRGSVR